MANSAKSLKSHLKSPICCQHGGCSVVSLSFPPVTKMSLDLASILLVKSVQALLSGMVSHAAFSSPTVQRCI